MFVCECYPNHEICRNRSTCEFWIPTSPELQQVTRQLEYELNNLKVLKQRRQEYNEILYEIRGDKYCKVISIKGKLTKVPKLNAKGNCILKPGDVRVGLNYSEISQDITDTESIIRALRRKEHDILKILKKRADKYV